MISMMRAPCSVERLLEKSGMAVPGDPDYILHNKELEINPSPFISHSQDAGKPSF